MPNQEPPKGFLSRIVSGSLKFRVVILIAALFVLGYGFYSLTKAKYDIFPEFTSPQVVIQTECPGLTSIQVEQLVTTQLETAILGAQGIQSILSTSIQGLSAITIFFESAKDVYLNRQLIVERLEVATPLLPKGIIPVVTPLSSSAGTIVTVGFTSDKKSLMEINTLIDWVIRPKLLAVPGVSSVVSIGGETEQLQVQVKSDELVKHRVALKDVISKAMLATEIQGAGFIDTTNQRINILTEGQTLTPEELGKTVVAHSNGQSVTLDQMGSVLRAPSPPFGAGAINGKAGIILQIETQYGSNTLAVTRGLDRAFQDLLPLLKKEGVVFHDNLFRQASFIDLALKNVEVALLIGAVLVIIILFVFLLNWKSVIIALIAIPLSMMAAIIYLNSVGISLNILTLGGLAIAMGLLVDDAVITVENIFRRVRENNKLETPRSTPSVILDATLEVRGAVVYATLAIILVFIPVFTLPGVAGRLFSPLVIAYISATLASLIVALTVTPVLAFFLIAGAKKEPFTIRWLKEKYKTVLEWVERHSAAVITITAIFIFGGFSTLFFVQRTYLPPMNENYLVLHIDFIPGTSLDESTRIGNLFSNELLKNPEVISIAQRAGRGRLSEDVHGTHQSEFDVQIKTSNVPKLKEDIRKLLSEFPGVNFSVVSFLTERINDTLSGYGADFIVNIFGNNFDELDTLASQVADSLNSISGAKDVLITSPPGTPEMTVDLKKNELRRWGINVADVLDAVSVAYQGKTVGQIYEGNRIFDVVVILNDEERNRPDKISQLLIKNPSNDYLELKQVADIFATAGRYNIAHEGGRRVTSVTCNVSSGVSVRTFENHVQEFLAKLNLPPGMYIELKGVAEAEKATEHQLLFHAIVAGLVIAVILYLILGSIPYVLLILCNLPFALVGGIVSLFFLGGLLSIGSLIGFVTVFGITLRNSIMIALHAQHLVLKEGKPWGKDTIILAAQERLAPILMTAMATGFGLLPIALQSGRPGSEIEGPVAVVILGGLITSTLLNLLILPTLMTRFIKRGAPARSAE